MRVKRKILNKNLGIFYRISSVFVVATETMPIYLILIKLLYASNMKIYTKISDIKINNVDVTVIDNHSF